MFENVVAMRVNDKRDISRFLEVRERRGFRKRVQELGTCRVVLSVPGCALWLRFGMALMLSPDTGISGGARCRAGPCMQGRAVLHLHPTTSPRLTRGTRTHPWEQKMCTDPPVICSPFSLAAV